MMTNERHDDQGKRRKKQRSCLPITESYHLSYPKVKISEKDMKRSLQMLVG